MGKQGQQDISHTEKARGVTFARNSATSSATVERKKNSPKRMKNSPKREEAGEEGSQFESEQCRSDTQGWQQFWQ